MYMYPIILWSSQTTLTLSSSSKHDKHQMYNTVLEAKKAPFVDLWEFGMCSNCLQGTELRCLGVCVVAIQISFVYRSISTLQFQTKTETTKSFRTNSSMDGPVKMTETRQGWKHKKTTLLWNNDRKERQEDYCTLGVCILLWSFVKNNRVHRYSSKRNYAGIIGKITSQSTWNTGTCVSEPTT